jgi:hypothetical protein
MTVWSSRHELGLPIQLTHASVCFVVISHTHSFGSFVGREVLKKLKKLYEILLVKT